MQEADKVPAPRTPLDLEVLFKRNYARAETKGRLKNISLSGAFLECGGDLFRANEKMQLQFIVEGRERTIVCSVIWVNSVGCGVKFMPVNNRDVQIVDDLIYYVENNRSSRRTVLDQIFKKVA